VEEEITAHLLAALDVLDHVLVRFCSGVHACLGSLDGQGERVHDNNGVSDNLSLHQAHDLVHASRSCVNDLQKLLNLAFGRPQLTHHLDERHGRYPAKFEVVGATRPILVVAMNPTCPTHSLDHGASLLILEFSAASNL